MITIGLVLAAYYVVGYIVTLWILYDFHTRLSGVVPVIETGVVSLFFCLIWPANLVLHLYEIRTDPMLRWRKTGKP